jgi:hypothetical protein
MSTTLTTVEQTVLDYYEGWYDADPERMRRALHPELAKRHLDEAEGAELRSITAQRMIELTEQGAGSEDGIDRTIEVDVLDVHRNIANALVRTPVYHEYVQLVRTDEGWKIVNVLWQKP